MFLPLLVAMLEVPDDSVDAVDAVDDVDSDDAFDDCSKSKCWAKVNDVKLLVELYLEPNHILLPLQIQGHALFIDTVNNDFAPYKCYCIMLAIPPIVCLNVIGASPLNPTEKII